MPTHILRTRTAIVALVAIAATLAQIRWGWILPPEQQTLVVAALMILMRLVTRRAARVRGAKASSRPAGVPAPASLPVAPAAPTQPDLAGLARREGGP